MYDMYAIYGNIYHQYTPNVSIYTIHGSYGYIAAPWIHHLWCFPRSASQKLPFSQNGLDFYVISQLVPKIWEARALPVLFRTQNAEENEGILLGSKWSNPGNFEGRHPHRIYLHIQILSYIYNNFVIYIYIITYIYNIQSSDWNCNANNYWVSDMQAQNHAKTKLWKSDLQKDILEFPKLTSLKRQMKRDFARHDTSSFCIIFPFIKDVWLTDMFFSPVFETKVDMSILSTGRRGTNCPDRGTQGLPRYFYWKQLLKSIYRMPRAWVKCLNKCDVTQAAFTPRIWAKPQRQSHWLRDRLRHAGSRFEMSHIAPWHHNSETVHDWLVVWNIWMIFPYNWECHHPNWRIPSFFRGVGLNHQPDEFFMIFDHLFAASDGQRLAYLADLRVGGGPRT